MASAGLPFTVSQPLQNASCIVPPNNSLAAAFCEVRSLSLNHSSCHQCCCQRSSQDEAEEENERFRAHDEQEARALSTNRCQLMLAAKEGDLEDFVKREFAHHENGTARLNNGSFGCCPASVLAAQAEWNRLWLSQPDKLFYGPLDEGFLAARRAIASVIRAPHVGQVVLVDNVTVAVSIVLQRVAWDFLEGRYQRGDAVLALNFGYGATKNALKAYVQRAGAHLIEVKLPFPVSSSEEILFRFNAVLQEAERESRRIRLALIDHITSMPSMVLPIQQLVRLCRRAGVDQVLVDGAHAIGSVDIDVQEIDADFYTSNLHKWLCTPSSVAFLHCKPEHLSTLHHPIVSHNYGNGIGSECAWVGTRDYSAHMATVNAIKFFENFEGGMKAVRDWNHRKVVSMGMMLAKAWGTQCGTPPGLCSTMIMVGLPGELVVSSEDEALNLRTRLRQDFGIEVPVYYCACDKSHENSSRNPNLSAYVRISHHIYNRLDDYLRLRDAVKFLTTSLKLNRRTKVEDECTPVAIKVATV